MEGTSSLFYVSRSKAERKRQRYNKILEKHETDIKVVEDATRFLLVGNGGVICGVECEDLVAAFQDCGRIEDVIMRPNKPYAFVTMVDEESAVVAVERIHGVALPNLNIKAPLYLSYVNRAPNIETLCQHRQKSLPPGLIILEEFLSEEEEEKWLQVVNCCRYSDHGNGWTTLKNRSVKHYGFEFNYDTSNVDNESPLPDGIPSECMESLQRLQACGYLMELPDQLTVNRYMPGQGIPPHVDTHSAFEDGIVSISLGSQVIMNFCHPREGHMPVILPSRSAIIMTGESRYLWSHGISSRKSDAIPTLLDGVSQLKLFCRKLRTSFTFRKVRRGKCTCAYKEQCDSQQYQEKPKQCIESESEARLLELQHVHQVYNYIASHFSATRHKPWPKIADFLSSLPPGSLLVDIGCGNGKYLGQRNPLIELGCDRSQSLISICKSRRVEVFVADALNLPLRSGIADACISIAVIHHFATEARRVRAIGEIARVLAEEGKALVYVWALEQEQEEEPSNYVQKSRQNARSVLAETENKLPYGMENAVETASKGSEVATELPVHVNRTKFEHQDLLVPWHLKTKTEEGCANNGDILHRYYHVFTRNELESLITCIPSIYLVDSYYDKGNWCALLQKQN